MAGGLDAHAGLLDRRRADALALAAVDETTAADALEKIKIEFQQLPHVLDPLDSLYPGGPNARSNGNVAAAQINLQTVKWQAGDFADDSTLPLRRQNEPLRSHPCGQLPLGGSAIISAASKRGQLVGMGGPVSCTCSFGNTSQRGVHIPPW